MNVYTNKHNLILSERITKSIKHYLYISTGLIKLPFLTILFRINKVAQLVSTFPGSIKCNFNYMKWRSPFLFFKAKPNFKTKSVYLCMNLVKLLSNVWQHNPNLIIVLQSIHYVHWIPQHHGISYQMRCNIFEYLKMVWK